MKSLLLMPAVAGILSMVASAGSIDYNTTGSTLSCNGLAGCVQNSATSISDGGLTLTYNSATGSGISTPSSIGLGNILATGSGTIAELRGLILIINVNSAPPGAGEALPNGVLSGLLTTDTSGATILFTPNNTTTAFGTLPGIVVIGGGQAFTYQVLSPLLSLVAPAAGDPLGETSIQGAVTDPSSTWMAEPSTLILWGAGLGAIGLLRLRRYR